MANKKNNEATQSNDSFGDSDFAKPTTNVQGFDNWDDDDSDGYEDYASDWVGFYQPRSGAMVDGQVLEHFQLEGVYGTENLVKIKLFKPTRVISGKGNNAEETIAKAGDVIAVRINAGLKVLLRCVENRVKVRFMPDGTTTKTKKGEMVNFKFKFNGQLSAPESTNTPF